MTVGPIVERQFRPLVAALCVLYVALAGSYALAMPMVMDEFQGAHAVLQHAEGVPYRDFTPYKTVLGYYLQLLPILASDDPWVRLVLVRLATVVCSGAALWLATMRLSRRVGKSALIVALAMLVAMSTFLEQSGALRVDMATAWFGLFCLLALLESRPGLAGLLAGVSFLVSQKGLYYMLAGGGALVVHGALVTRGRAGAVAVVRFAAGALAPIAVYVGGFGMLSSLEAVFRRVFLAHVAIAVTDLYDIRAFWWQTIERNPLFYAMAALAIVVLSVRRTSPGVDRPRAIVLCGFASVLAILCALHRQPWPYFFVLLVPTCLVLHAHLLDLVLPRPGRLRTLVILAVLVLGIGLPLVRRVPVVLARDSSAQRTHVELAERLIAPDETYLAGLAMVNTREHVDHERLGWLDRRHLRALEGVDPAAIIGVLERSSLRLLISNYRLAGLPRPVLELLGRDYVRVHGNLFLYGPRFAQGATTCPVRLPGVYRPRSVDGSPIELAGARVADGERIEVLAGPHPCRATAEFRLMPVVDGVSLDPDAPRVDLFEAVYTF